MMVSGSDMVLSALAAQGVLRAGLEGLVMCFNANGSDVADVWGLSYCREVLGSRIRSRDSVGCVWFSSAVHRYSGTTARRTGWPERMYTAG